MNVFLLAVTAFSALIINQSVGIVDKNIITAREVQVALVIEKILDNQKGLFEIQPQDPKFPKLVSTYLLEKAAVIEADSFAVGHADENEVKEALAKIEKTTAGKSYWKSLEATSDYTKQILTTKLVARNFIKFKTESMTSIITDAEAQAYFERNRAKFGAAPFEAFRDNIKTFLTKQQRQQRLRSWFEVLKKKYKIRNILLEDAKTPQETADSQAKPSGN
jgi:hypothetical protein